MEPRADVEKDRGSLSAVIEDVRRRYREERDKRINPAGVGQYGELDGRFKALARDPWSDPHLRREPYVGEVDVLVIGGGFAGLSVGARLVMAGLKNFRIVEAGGDFGGTWYWNRYPGARCDTESYIYLPLLEETGYVPKEKYAAWSEIFEHAQRIGNHFKLYDRAFFQTRVSQMRWDGDLQVWRVRTDSGDEMTARFVVKTNGTLDRPKLPRISGLETFEGHILHTSRWDYEYTGGDPSGKLTGLMDKRVAVVGTGATGVQVVPNVAKSAQHLYVVQRTPSTIAHRGNLTTDPNWAASLSTGWHRSRRHNFVALTSGVAQDQDLVGDGWTKAVHRLGGMFVTGEAVDLAPEELLERLEIADFDYMEAIRQRIDKIVEDPATAAALKPWYRYFCKRPCFSDEYLPTFNRDNVTLLDTQGKGPDCIGKKSITVQGVSYDVDCIIFATGFEVGTDPVRRAGYETYGRDGLKLSEAWSRGMDSLHGCMTHGFPNLFQTGLGQNGVSYVFTYSTDEQATHIVEILKSLQRRGAHYVEPAAEAQAAWVESIMSKSSAAVEFQKQCTPGLYNNEGASSERRSIVEEAYGGGPIEFYQLIEAWRLEGMSGLNIK